MSKKQRRHKASKKKTRQFNLRKARLSSTASKQTNAPTVVHQNKNAPLMPILKKNAHYKCCACAHRYWFYPGAVSPPNVMDGEREQNVCPKCTSLYVKWLNYDTDFSSHAYIC